MATWQIQQAKSKLSELIEKARSEGPQTITKHGKPTAVIVSEEQFQAMRNTKPDFVEFLLNAPKFEDLDLERSKDVGREVDLG
jgi:prevent-host-death family protein